MSAIPPKQAPDASSYESPETGNGMVAMYNAASHANAESFPVLKAFQDYLEAERTQARKRVIQLSVFYAVLMGVVVTGFLCAGIFMLRNMTSMQNKLLDVALASKTTAPAAAPAQTVQPSPVSEESVKQMSRLTTELQSSMDKKLDGVSAIATQVNEKIASQDGEMEKLRAELLRMQEQSSKLKDDLVSIKTESRRPAPAGVFQPPPKTGSVQQMPPPVPKSETAVAAPTVAAAPTPALPDPRFPPAVKNPPASPPGVTAPAAPKGMMATAIPLKTKNIGTVPWRVLIPE